MSLAREERLALVETMRAVGPDAPTLCGTWTTRDLAAHLILRESRPDAAAGIFFGPPAYRARSARIQNEIASQDWEKSLKQIAAGPPWYSPFKPIDAQVNLNEMFIHHEDVLRAQPGWKPRELSAQLAAGLRRPLKLMGKRLVANSPAEVTLVTRDGVPVFTAGTGSPVTVTGDIADLALFAFGREQIQVEYSGDPDAIELVKAASRKL